MGTIDELHDMADKLADDEQTVARRAIGEALSAGMSVPRLLQCISSVWMSEQGSELYCRGIARGVHAAGDGTGLELDEAIDALEKGMLHYIERGGERARAQFLSSPRWDEAKLDSFVEYLRQEQAKKGGGR